MKTVTLQGNITVVDGAGCGCSSGQITSPLGLGPPGSMSGGCCTGGLVYDEAAAVSVTIATVGLPGAQWVDIKALDQFTSIEFLRLVSSARIRLRINPTRPQLTGTTPIPGGGVVAGAATFTVTDSVGVQYAATVVFSGATNTPALVVGAINAALAGAGAPFPPDGQIARLVGGTLVIVSPGIGPAAFVQLAAGAPVDLGLGIILIRVSGTSSDMADTEGLVILQFPRSPNAPTKVQVSGTATIDIVAAGRVT
jgi:hypothetical protein